MHNKQLYEYAIMRYVPVVERGEYINVGVLMYSKKTNFLAFEYLINTERLNALFTHADLNLLKDQLEGFWRIVYNNSAICKSPIAKLDNASKFRWLSANRSTIIQCSPIHVGYADDLNITLENLKKNYL